MAGAAGRAPQRLLAALGAAVDDLPDRITCSPPPPAPEQHGHGHGRGKGHGHGDENG